MGRDGRARRRPKAPTFNPPPAMIFATKTNPRTKFNRWISHNPVVPFELDAPKRPAVFTPRNRIKALTEIPMAEVYVMQLPTRPAA